MPYEIRKVNGKFAVAKKGAMGVKKAYAKLDDAKRYMRALYANEKDPATIVAALEAETLDEVCEAAVSDKIVEAERKFPGNRKPNVKPPERELVTAIRRAGMTAAARPPASIRIGKAVSYSEGIGEAAEYTEKDPKKLKARKAAKKKKAVAGSGEESVAAALGRPFDESKHRRAPKGVREGGRFVSVAQGPGSYTVEDKNTGEVIAETRTAAEATAIENDANAADSMTTAVQGLTDAELAQNLETWNAAPESASKDQMLQALNDESGARAGMLTQADTLESEAAKMRDLASDTPVGQQISQRADELDRGAAQLRSLAADPSPAEYADLVARAEANGIPTSLDDPLSPDTVPELAERVRAAEEGGPVNYAALAEDADNRVGFAADETEREFWQRKADEHWGKAPMLESRGAPLGGFDNGVEFHQIGDQVYRVPAGAEISTVTGLPMGARWESSVEHWNTFKDVEGTVPFQATRPTLSVNESQDAPGVSVERGLRRSSAEAAALAARSREQYASAPQAGELKPGDVFANPVTGEPVEVADVSHQPPIVGRDGNVRVGGSTKITTPDGKTFALPSSERLQGHVQASGITASAAGMAPDVPPAEWFDDPQFTELTPLTVTPDGRVYGHIAPWGACHTGIQGRCVQPPRSSDGLPYFNLAAVDTDNGVRPVGKITMDTGHASLVASPKATAAHYDNTGVVAADVHAGQDRFGPWIAGAIRPELDARQARALSRATVSGDWRKINGKHELVGLLAVNVPGFPIPRAGVAVMASGEEYAIAAAGVICDCDDVDESLDEIVIPQDQVAARRAARAA